MTYPNRYAGPAPLIAFAALLALLLGWMIEAMRHPEDPATAPAPAQEALFSERDVVIPSGDIELAGTLTLPPGPGPFPAVLSISGAGKQDRTGGAKDPAEARLMPHLFARAGIALLRTDDRGVGGSGGDSFDATLTDLVVDAAASVAFLARQGEIDPKGIGLLGASQGALLAAQAAAEHPEVAFAVLYSGPGRVGHEVLFDQIKRIEKAGGLPQATVDEILRLTEEGIGLIRAEIDETTRRDRLRPIVQELRRLRRTSPFAAQDTQASIEREIDILTSPMYRSSLAYDPAGALRLLRCPVLVIYGGLDLQAHPEFNRPPVEAALAAAPTDDVTITVLPGLNHYLQPAETGHPSEYATGRRSPQVYERTAAWIAERFSVEGEDR